MSDGKEVGQSIVTDQFNPRSDISLRHILAARSNYLVDSNLTELLSVIFPSNLKFTVSNPDGSQNEEATRILTNMAAMKETALWYFMLQLYDDIFTYGCLIANRFYTLAPVSGGNLYVLNLRRLPPETFTEIPSSVKGTQGIILGGLVKRDSGIEAYQTYSDPQGKAKTELLPTDSILILTDPRYASKVGGESRLRGVIPLLQNLNRGFVNLGRATDRAGVPTFMLEQISETVQLTEDDKRAIRAFVEDQAEDSSVVMPFGVTGKPVPFTANNLCKIYVDLCIAEIKAFFNPTAWLSNSGISLVGSMKSQLELIKMSIAGQRAMVEDHVEAILNEWLEVNGWTDCTASVIINEVNLEDVATTVTKTKTAWDMGIINVNEARVLLDLPELNEEELTSLSESRSPATPDFGSLFTFKKDIPSAKTNEGEPHVPGKVETSLVESFEDIYNQTRDNLVLAIGNDQAIDGILSISNEKVIQALALDAARGYVQGSFLAYMQMGMDPNLQNMSTRMQVFMVDYANLAIKQGVTIINGEPNDWIKRKQESERKEIYDIILSGMRDGKYPGVKEDPKKGYQKGTIGYDLQGYFDDRKSHATTVARTETGRMLNVGALETYGSLGVTDVKVLDGDGQNPCDICNQLNGQIWKLDYAMTHELEHPNCVRSFTPIKPKDGYTISSFDTKLFKSLLTILNRRYVISEAS
jgi:hypothetical protein